MIIDLPTEWVLTAITATVSVLAGLYTRAVNVKVEAIKSDVKRIDDEVKVQRQSLTDNREAVIKLTSSVDRLNEILKSIESALTGRVSTQQCSFYRMREDTCKHSPSDVEVTGE